MTCLSVAERTRTVFFDCLITRVVLPSADFVPTATSSTSSTPIPTTSSTSTPAPSPSKSLSSAAIGGIAGGIVGGFVLAAAILGFIFYRRTKTKNANAPPPVQQIDYNDPEYLGNNDPGNLGNNDPETLGKPESENTPNQVVYPVYSEPISGRTNLIY